MNQKPITKKFDEWCIHFAKEIKLYEDYSQAVILIKVIQNRPDILSKIDTNECKIFYKDRSGNDKFFTFKEYLDEYKKRTTISTKKFKNFDFLKKMSEEERAKWYEDNPVVFDIPHTKDYEMANLVYSVIGII